MAAAFSRLIQELQKSIPGVRGECHELWGSHHSSSRPTIRASIESSLSGWKEADRQVLADLSQPPRPYDRSISISHTHNLGGWMAVPRPAQIGWDVELKTRIKVPIVKRVSSDNELTEAPAAAFLWSAKEAFFKALEDDQPQAILQLNVAEWQSLGSDMWAWRGLGPRNGNGLLIDAEPWIFAACLIP